MPVRGCKPSPSFQQIFFHVIKISLGLLCLITLNRNRTTKFDELLISLDTKILNRPQNCEKVNIVSAKNSLTTI